MLVWGSLKLFASNNAGNYAHTITNASFGQATNFVIHDPANAAAVVMVGAGAAPFVIGNIPVATSVAGVFADSGIIAADYQPLTQIVTMNTASVVGAYATPVQIIAGVVNKGIVVLYAAIIAEVSTAFATGGIAQLQFGNTNHGGGNISHSYNNSRSRYYRSKFTILLSNRVY